MANKSPEEIRNNALFGNRRKMAFWSLYVVIGVTVAITIKILIAETTAIEQFTPILSWCLSILGGIILAFIGAATVEQTFSPSASFKSTKKDETDKTTPPDNYPTS